MEWLSPHRLLGAPLYITGVCLLYLLTAGRRKPEWFPAERREGVERAFSEGPIYGLGFLFWVAVIVLWKGLVSN